MCFSAPANFAAATVIAAVGVATLPHVRHPRAVLFAVTPLLFALHQFTEGFVWLGRDGRIDPMAFDHSVFLFILYAQGILSFLMPLAVLLIEPRGWRWLGIFFFTFLGFGLLCWTVYAVMSMQSHAYVDHHSIAYRNPGTDNAWVAGLYVAAVCGALILSTHRVVTWFGIANALGLTIVLVVRGYAFTSVWCLYAAIISIMIYWQFSRGRINMEQPNNKLESGDARTGLVPAR